MAFTAAQLPVDKDQSSFWQSNEGELGVANDHFFDQFVTFEAGEPTTSFDCEVLEDPPSPSLLLDTLDDCLTNSSNDHGSSYGGTSSDENTAKTAAARHISSALSNSNSGDPMVGGGSISDSELLRLEGISLQSSPGRALATAPSSPSLLPTSSLSPRKRNRLVDSVYATYRRVAHRPKRHIMHAENNVFDINGDEADILRELQSSQSSAAQHIGATFEPTDNNGLPLSPPLTGKIPPPGYQSRSKSGFVSGPLEDPFANGLFISPPAAHQIDGQHTPLPTPGLNDDFFCLDSSQPVDQFQTSARLPKQRSTSSAEWPMAASVPDNSQLWSAGSYVPDSGSLQSSEWWESTPDNRTSSHNTASQNKARNASINLTMHNQQAELPYEYTSDLSGLMIHMPQPRQPQAAVLTAHIPDQISTPQHRSRPPHQHYHSNTDHRQRRPVPRAPSSGARHRQHLPAHGFMTSPRKHPTLHHSSSRPILIHREESTSPTPTAPRHRSSSMSVRKQRSWSRREPRTPNPHQHHSFSAGSGYNTPTTPAATTPISSSFGGGGLDFVNFTPSDKGVLMTGVAPSGSSKTKARREKEAVERRRKLSEAAVKAVQAAGGDLDRLLAEGFTL
ncbi:hypothetical protein PG993_001856 [Apiospora rasikravindrae]|uniref:Developmental regulatory protein wetA n=1 Tax=Apiospora rasikravindrae TaxID=990691 RepID=A0ABR1UFJ1_9PEZI